MQALNGLMPPVPVHAGHLKRCALLFDKLYIWTFDTGMRLTNSQDVLEELTFLNEAEFLVEAKVNLDFKVSADVSDTEFQIPEIDPVLFPGDSE